MELLKIISCHFWPKSGKHFFSIRVFFPDPDDSQDNRTREGTIVYSTLPLPSALEHSDIYLQLCMWDDYHIFLIVRLVFIRRLLDEIYHLIELPLDWLINDAVFVCLIDELILSFCYSNFDIGNWWTFTSSFTLVLQANRLTKCVSVALTWFKFGISSYNCHTFPLRWFYNHSFLL